MLACMAAAVALSVYDSVVKPVAYRMLYDNRPPASFLSARLRHTTLQSGEPIAFSFVYTKRAECHPPMTERGGLVRFRVWHNANDYIWLRFENFSHAAPTDIPTEKPFREVPLPPLAPGTYRFQWVATYNCLDASGPQIVESPILEFHVI